MALDPEYLDAIKGFEGYSPSAAWDYKQSSSGYGTKAQPGDEAIPPDQFKAVHEQRFQDEVAKAAAHVDSINPDLPPGARAALTSLTYNAGPGWSQSGLGELVRKGDLQGAQAKLLEYNKAGGEVNPGLVARRQKEATWFTQPQAAPVPSAGPPVAPMNLAPPIFAQQPQAAQAAPQQQTEGGGFEMPAPMPAPPIFAAKRPQVDLQKLRAAFKAPIFGNRA